MLYLSARASITKYHRLGGLNNRSLFSHSSGGEKSVTKGLLSSVSGKGSFPGVFGAHTQRERALPGVPACKDTNPIGSGFHLYDSLNFNYFPVDPVSKNSHTRS